MSVAAADQAADQLGVTQRQVYALVRRWRAGDGVAAAPPGMRPRPRLSRFLPLRHPARCSP
nr:helix-turn-helix domain-containing protein [Nocardia rhizosphaerihabitans]